jgi:hypothetical protein
MIMFNRKKLTVAVGIAVGATAGVLSTAQAGQLFFPQAIVGNTVTTIFSVINTKGNKPGKPGKDQLHYRWYYKDATMLPAVTEDAETNEDNANAVHCEEFNKYLPTSKYDIQTIDIGGDLPGGVDGVLFNDPSNKNNWHGNDYAMARTVPRPARGYLFVEHADTMGLASDKAGLYGEAVVFEFGSGAAWGYQGFWKRGSEGESCDYQKAASNSPSHVAIFPLEGSAFTTKFMVTPLWDVMSDPAKPVSSVCPDDNNWNTTTVELQADYGNNVVMYDRDENPISGATKKKVACVGAISAKYLINNASQASLADGGWTGVLNYSNAIDGDGVVLETIEPSAVIYKLEYGSVSSIDSETENGGIFNNASYLLPDAKWDIKVKNP